jgi:transposase
MTEADTGLLNRLVVGHKRDGRCRYDPNAKRELIEKALVPGVSVAGLALGYGINANLLRTWMHKYRGDREAGVAATTVASLPAFIPVVPAKRVTAAERSVLTIHLPNGVRLEFGQAAPDDLAGVLQSLHALPCSGSTRG